MDFAFAPGLDDQSTRVRALFERRAATTLIKGAGVSALRQFITHLDKTTSISKPVGDLVIGAHANNEGELFMPMFAGQGTSTQFETLEITLKDATKSIQIPDRVIGFKTGDPVTHAVHIKGCNLGQALPFLTKMKQALGGHVKITAPKLFHGVTPAPAEGVFEYMGYQFAISRAQPFPNLKTALDEWDAQQFSLIDGNTVPTDAWKTLVFKHPNVSRFVNVKSKLGIKIGKRATLSTPREYRVIPVQFGPFRIQFRDRGSVPQDDSSRLSEIEKKLAKDKLFLDTHPYPGHKRQGFDRVIEFVSGHTWHCRQDGAELECIGTRVLYMVVFAITDPATAPPKGFFGDGTLIFNFYPNAKSPLTALTSAIQVTDPKYFVTV